jgi:type IV pilus assembly protein PilC
MSQLISNTTGILLFRQLAATTRSNLSLHEVLEILSKDSEMFGRDFLAVDALARQLSEGGTLSSALMRLPELVAPETAELVRVAEDKDNLAQILDAIADDYTELEQRRVSIRAALSWPLTILAIAAVLVGMMMIFVIPAFKDMYSSFGSNLPGPTLLIMAVSDFFVSCWWLFAILIAVFFVLKRKNKIPQGLVLIAERALLAIPFARKYFVQAFASRTISWIQVAHKDPELLLATLVYLRASTNFSSFKLCLLNLESRIANSTSISQALLDLAPLPKRFALFMQIGEKNKDIDGALALIADFSESERISKLAGFERWLTLCIYCVLGITVGLFVIGMYLPIFKMGQAV